MNYKIDIRSLIHLIILAVFFTAAIAIGGIYYYKNEKKITRNEKFDELKAIADLKSNQIEQWQQERYSEVTFFSKDNTVIKSTENLLNGNKSGYSYLKSSLSHILSGNRYQGIFILDTANNLLFSTDNSLSTIDSATVNLSKQVILENRVIISDFYFCKTHSSIHLDFMSPIKNQKDKIIATITFRVSPDDYLFPLIQRWPTPSKTAETLIIRKEKDSVAFINRLRHVKNEPLKLKIALTRKDIPAVTATTGYSGLFEGTDYRGVPVLSMTKKISGTNWYMIAKVDEDEIFHDLYTKATFIVIISIISFLLFNITVLGIYNLKERNIYRQLLSMERNLHQSEEEFRLTLYSIGDGVITTDIHGKIKRMNPVASELTGWTESEAAGKELNNIFNIVNEETHETAQSPVERIIHEGGIIGLGNHTLLLSRTGKKIPIVDSGAPIFDKSNQIIGVVIVFRDQTAERESQRLSRMLHNKISSIVYTSPLPIIVTDLKGEVTLWNKAAEETFGWKIHEVLNAAGLLIPDDKQLEIQKILQQVINGKTFKNVESVLLKKNGEKIHVSFSISLLRDQNRKPHEILSIIADITERKQTENELKEKELQYRNLANSGLALIWTADTNRLCNYFNEPWLKFTGRTLAQELGNGWVEGIHMDDYETRIKTYETAFDQRQSFEMEYRLRHSSGEYRWIRDMGTPNYNSRGEFIGYIGHCFDITEKKMVEQELETSERNLKLFVEYAPAAIAMLDNNMQYIAVSNQFLRDYRLASKNIIGLSHYEVFPDIPERWKKIHRSCLQGNIERCEDDMFPREDGSLDWVRWEIHPWFKNTDEIGGILLFSEVITQRKLAEEKIRKSEEKFHSTLDSMIEGCQIIGHDWRYIYINKAAEIQNQQLAEQMIGKKYLEIWPELESTQLYSLMKNCMEQRNAHSFESEFTFPNGTMGWFLLSVQPIPEGIFILSENITEKKNAEQNLKHKDELIHLTGDIAKVSGWEFDVATNKITWTSEVFKLYDLDTNANTDIETIINFYSNESREKLEFALKEAVAHAKPYDLTLEVVSTKKTHKWIRTIGIPLVEHGHVYKIRGISQDITEQVKTSEKHIQSEKRFKTLVEAAPEAIFIQTKGQFAYLNPAALKLFRAENDSQLIGKPVTDFISLGKVKTKNTTGKNLNLNKKNVTNLEASCTTVAGIPFDVQISSVPFTFNHVNGVLFFMHDITEQKRAQSEILQLNNQLQHLIQVIQQLSKANNLELIMQSVLISAKNFMGADGATFVLRDNNECYYADERAISPLWKGSHFPMDTCISGWTMMNREMAIIEDIYKDSRIPHDVYKPTFVKSLAMVPINTAEPKGAIGIYWAKQYTPQKDDILFIQALADAASIAMENVRVYGELEKRVEQRTEQLEMANKELEAFSYSVSHDLRAPLRAIHGFIQILSEDYNDKIDEEGNRLMSIIQENTLKMSQLIDDLLAFSRVNRTEIKKSIINFNALVQTVINENTILEERKNIKFSVKKLPQVYGDINLFHQVWENLISNAIKYTSKTEVPLVEIGFAETDNFYEFYIKDNGSGFEMQYVDKLFNVFQRLHSDREFAGTGVGLAIVQRIVTKHGGSVSAVGKVNEGATFYFTVPK